MNILSILNPDIEKWKLANSSLWEGKKVKRHVDYRIVISSHHSGHYLYNLIISLEYFSSKTEQLFIGKVYFGYAIDRLENSQDAFDLMLCSAREFSKIYENKSAQTPLQFLHAPLPSRKKWIPIIEDELREWLHPHLSQCGSTNTFQPV